MTYLLLSSWMSGSAQAPNATSGYASYRFCSALLFGGTPLSSIPFFKDCFTFFNVCLWVLLNNLSSRLVLSHWHFNFVSVKLIIDTTSFSIQLFSFPNSLSRATLMILFPDINMKYATRSLVSSKTFLSNFSILLFTLSFQKYSFAMSQPSNVALSQFPLLDLVLFHFSDMVLIKFFLISSVFIIMFVFFTRIYWNYKV